MTPYDRVWMTAGALVGAALLAAGAQETNAVPTRQPGHGEPGRFEKEIAAFEAADRKSPPPQGAIVVAGSSSIRMWHKTMRADLAPLTVIPRGFGGSTMNDLLHYAPRVIVAYKPRAVVVYEGDNDMAAHIDPALVVAQFESLVALLHKDLPKTRIYYLSCKPSPSRVGVWPKAVQLNDRIKALCARDTLLLYIDVATPLLDAQGAPRPELFGPDKLHMARAGYELWTQAIKPVLMAREGAARIP